MRIVRYQTKQEPARYGWLLDEKVGEIRGSLWGDFEREEAKIDINDVQLLAPVEPRKIVCIGRNYAAHAAEHDVEVPDIPLLFMKPPTAIIGPGEAILLPPQSTQVEHEAEMAVVIGKTGKWVTAEEAGDYILGYTIANDVTARDLQRQDGQWTRGKGFDTFCPVGPWIETEFDASDALITCYVGEEMRQMGSTRDMIFSPRQLIAYISTIMTIEAGDLILTGTPSGVARLQDSDSVRIEIEGIGQLLNPVKADQTAEKRGFK